MPQIMTSWQKMKRKKASNKTDCWLFSVIESVDNAICMGDSCGTRHFNSIWETHHRRVPLCWKPGRHGQRERETERERERERGIQSDRGAHVKLSETPMGEAVADMIIDPWPWLVIGHRNRPYFCISSWRWHSCIQLWHKAEESITRGNSDLKFCTPNVKTQRYNGCKLGHNWNSIIKVTYIMSAK